MSYCDYFVDQLEPDNSVDPNYPIPTTTVTPITTLSTTTDISTGAVCDVPRADTAALIVGGFFRSGDTSQEVKSHH